MESFGFGAERSYSDSEVVSDRKKQRELTAGADILIKQDMCLTGRSFPMKRVTFKKTQKQNMGRFREGWDFALGECTEGKVEMKQERRLDQAIFLCWL